MRKVIVNTSPLQYLYQLGQIELLQHLYGEIAVPISVVNELARGQELGIIVPHCAQYEWMQQRAVRIKSYLPLVTGLGAGEKEVIALALEHREGSEDALVVLDDGLARCYASHVGLLSLEHLEFYLKHESKAYYKRSCLSLTSLQYWVFVVRLQHVSIFGS
jgi:predicted nucleic acid-binding protein